MNILVLCDAGIGGTEKAAFLFAEALVRRGHHVVAFSNTEHPRTTAFHNAGGIIVSGDYSHDSLLRVIRQHGIQVIHQHVSGYSDQRDIYAALDSLGSARPKLIETNVFGQLLDPHDQGHVDFRMFITFTSGMQAFMRTRMEGSVIDHSKCGVLFYPMPEGEFAPNAARRAEFRKELGVEEGEYLVIRIGRPGHKWATWECEAFAVARTKNPSLRMLLMEPNAPIAADVKAGKYGEGIIVKAATSDTSYLAALYNSADLMLHASDWGESYGYTVAEAMQAALPVITRATPWGDNAQTELVIHGKTGYVCGSVRGLSKALLELSTNKERSTEFGTRGAERIARVSSLEHETDILEDIIRGIFEGKTGKATLRRFQKWIEFIDSRNRDTPAYYERGNRDWLGVINTKLYCTFREAKTLKKYFRQRFVRRRRVLFPTRKVHLPPNIRDENV